MRKSVFGYGLLFGTVLCAAGCDGFVSLGGGVGDGGGGQAGSQGDAQSVGVGGDGGGTVAQGGSAGASTTGTTSTNTGVCASGPDDDADNDGFTPAQGDCNDCEDTVNPNALEAPTTPGQPPRDENCDGQLDEASAACDGGLALNDSSPISAANAVDICKISAGPADWGLADAVWVLSDGSPAPAGPEYALGHGILDGFGPNVAVRQGAQLLALSSGTARRPNDADYVDGSYVKGYPGLDPAGFPKPSPACPGVTTGTPYDAAALEVTLRAPSNASGFAFDFDFYTHEFPAFVCSPFNDLFVAMLSPIPNNQADGNISFDSLGNTVSVNNVFLEACGCQSGPPCQAGGQIYPCGLGTAELLGTGFDSSPQNGGGNGATGWLTTSAPADPGSTVSLRFAIHDSGDSILDSTVLVDNFRWITQGVPLVQTIRAPGN